MFVPEQRSAEESGQGDVETGDAGPMNGHQQADHPRALGSIHQLREYVRSSLDVHGLRCLPPTCVQSATVIINAWSILGFLPLKTVTAVNQQALLNCGLCARRS